MELAPGIITLMHVDEERRQELIGKEIYKRILATVPIMYAIDTYESRNHARRFQQQFTALRFEADMCSPLVAQEFKLSLEKAEDYIVRWSGGNKKKIRLVSLLQDFRGQMKIYEESAPILFSSNNQALLPGRLINIRSDYDDITTPGVYDIAKGRRFIQALKLMMVRYVDSYRTYRTKERRAQWQAGEDMLLIGDVDTFLLDAVYFLAMHERNKHPRTITDMSFAFKGDIWKPFHVFGIPRRVHRMSHMGPDYTQEMHDQFLVATAIEKLEAISVNWRSLKRLHPYGVARPTAIEAGNQALKLIEQNPMHTGVNIRGWMESLQAPDQGPGFYIRYVFLLIDAAECIKHYVKQLKGK